jgi:hypothetical protein
LKLVNVVSKQGQEAWQFMPETAKGMGLEVNNNVDERYSQTYAGSL